MPSWIPNMIKLASAILNFNIITESLSVNLYLMDRLTHFDLGIKFASAIWYVFKKNGAG